MKQPHDPIAHVSGRCPTTDWSLVLAAADDRDHLGDLIERYWGPAFVYSRRSGLSSDDASEAVQSFFEVVVLGRDFVRAADEERGRFRSYLLTALRRHLIDIHRQRAGRRGDRPQTLMHADLDASTGSEHPEPHAEEAFHDQWVVSILHAALIAVERECRGSGLTRHWEAFELRILRPAIRLCEPMSLEDLVAHLDLDEEQQVSNMIQVVKRRLRRAVRDMIIDESRESGVASEELAFFLQRFGVLT